MTTSPGDYGNCHRYFVQEMMAVGMLDSTDVKKLFKQSCQMFPEGQAWDGDRDLLTFIKAVTNKLKPLGMQLKKQISEDAHKKGQSKNTFYVLTCTTDRSTKEYPELTSKAMHDFKPKEIEYIKVLMNNILQSEDKEITITSAINSTMEMGPNKLTMDEAQRALEAFSSKQWLKQSSNGNYIRLSVRFIAEMQSYLLNLRTQAEECEDEDHPGWGVNPKCKQKGCNQMVVRGIRCENCPNETFHYYCLTDPNGNGQETHAKCPICKADMDLSLGRDGGQTQNTQRRGGGGGGGSQHPRPSTSSHGSGFRNDKASQPPKRKRINQLESSSDEDEAME